MKHWLFSGASSSSLLKGSLYPAWNPETGKLMYIMPVMKDTKRSGPSYCIPLQGMQVNGTNGESDMLHKEDQAEAARLEAALNEEPSRATKRVPFNELESIFAQLNMEERRFSELLGYTAGFYSGCRKQGTAPEVAVMAAKWLLETRKPKKAEHLVVAVIPQDKMNLVDQFLKAIGVSFNVL